MALAKLVGRVEWVAGNAPRLDREAASVSATSVRSVIEAAAETLRLSASLICDGGGYPVDDPALVRAVQAATRSLDQADRARTRRRGGCAPRSGHPPGRRDRHRSPSWRRSRRRRHLAGSVLPRPGPGHRHRDGVRCRARGRRGPGGRRPETGDIARVHGVVQSGPVWPPISRSARCGSATPCAARPDWPSPSPWSRSPTSSTASGWCSGTLSVLRSNALGTGATALRAVGGTAVGLRGGFGHHGRGGQPHGAAVGAPPDSRAGRRAWPLRSSRSPPARPASPWW